MPALPLNNYLLVDTNEIADDTTESGLIISSTADKDKPGLAKGHLKAYGHSVPEEFRRECSIGAMIWFKAGLSFRPVGATQSQCWVKVEDVFGFSRD